MIETPEITVRTIIKAPVEKVWKLWTTPADIMQWNNPFEDWHSPRVEVDLKEQGRFFFRMETKEANSGFDHAGEYDKIIPHQVIEYTVDDGRKAKVTFVSKGNETVVTETFEPEAKTPLEIQKDFCQIILKKFKEYAEKMN